MTVTVKLPPALEHTLRQRSAALGKPASALIREALSAYLEATAPSTLSAYELGADVFGKYSGPADLASTRKQALLDEWTQKQMRRTSKGRRG